MRKGIFYISFFLIINSGNAQINEPVIISSTPTKNLSGLYIGFSSIEHNAVINGQKFSSSNSAFNLGLVFEKEFNEKVKMSLRPGIVLTDDIKNNFTINGKNYSYVYQSVLFELPLLLIYSIKSNRAFNGIPNYIHFGPVFNYNVANKSIRFNGSYNFIPSFARENEGNLKFGFGYEIKSKFVNLRPEFAYNLGFNSFKSNTLPNLNLTQIRNNQISFHLIISQRMNKVIYKKIKRIDPLPSLWKNVFRSAKKPKIF
jgi:hypothetical protein